MARKEAAEGQEETNRAGGETNDATRFDRRSYLGITGLAGLVLGSGLGGASVPAAASGGKATESAAGTGGDADARDAQLPNTLTVRGTGTPTSYEFTVDGALAENPSVGAPDGWENIAETTATGQVTAADAADGYRFSGSIVDVTLAGGDARLVLNGEEVTPDEAVEATALPNTLTVQGTGTPASYEFTVDGTVQAAPESGDLAPWDNVEGRTVEGWVTEPTHVDTYRFAGEVTQLAVDGTADVVVDEAD